MNVLVVEDDTLLGTGLLQALQQSGYNAILAASGAAAMAELSAGDPDLIILDLGLPDMDGLHIVQRLRRERNAVPVLVITARDGIEQRVQALDSGADDYIEKPFDLRELEARVRALLRRSRAEFEQEISIGRLTLNVSLKEVRVGGHLIELPGREYEVLEILVTNQNKTVTKMRIAQRLTASNQDIGDNAVEVYVHRLRRRLADFGLSIRTLRGVGYLIELATRETS